MPKKPRKLTSSERETLALLTGDLAEFYEAQCDGTLDDKMFENRLYKRRVAAKPRRTSNPSPAEIYDARMNRTVMVGGKRMRRIEVRILRLVGMGIGGDMGAADELMDMYAQSKRQGDFKLEEEFDRYPIKESAGKKHGGKEFDPFTLFANAMMGKKSAVKRPKRG